MRFILPLLFVSLLHAQEDKKPEKKDSSKTPQTQVTKQDVVTIDGKKIDYKVTAATLNLKTDKSLFACDENFAAVAGRPRS